MPQYSMPVGMPGMVAPGMDMNNPAYFNPYMFGMQAAMPSWFPMSGSAASFHLPGPKNEIKLFVGGLQFQTTE